MLFDFLTLHKRDLQIYSRVDIYFKPVFLNEKKSDAHLLCAEHALISELVKSSICFTTNFKEVRIMLNTHTCSIQGVST